MFSSTPACRYQTTDYPNSCIAESYTSRNNRDQLGVIYFSWMYVNAYDFDISSILIKSWILAKNCTSSNKCFIIHHKQVHAFMYGTSIYMKITATNFQLI